MTSGWKKPSAVCS